jgi:hypothetical protein
MLVLTGGHIEWRGAVCRTPVHTAGLLMARQPQRPAEAQPLLLVHERCAPQAELLLPGATIRAEQLLQAADVS